MISYRAAAPGSSQAIFTKGPTEPFLAYTAFDWTFATLLLSSTGPVRFNTNGDVNGALLSPDVPWTLLLAPGGKLYIVGATGETISMYTQVFPLIGMLADVLVQWAGQQVPPAGVTPRGDEPIHNWYIRDPGYQEWLKSKNRKK